MAADNRRRIGRFTVKREIDDDGYYGPRRWGVYSADGLIKGGFTDRQSAVDTAEGLEKDIRSMHSVNRPDTDTVLVMYRVRPVGAMIFTERCVGRRMLGRFLIQMSRDFPDFTILAIGGMEEGVGV